ncbi:DUF1127 domain-containing protein [Rhodobacteraceae bacterium NNCM2]|nr:DUF1127 domain-containing protein [Coraliihabitans acroporae]
MRSLSFLQSVPRGVFSAARRWQDRRARAAAIRDLERLDPAVLRDIGLSRGELMALSLDDPTRRHRR